MDQSEKKIFIHLGTYNGAIIGFEGNLSAFENIYAYSPNLGSVKCVSTTGRYLLTGGFDEIIRIYDLKKRREQGQLVGHEGTITCLRTYKNFVISGGEDGNLIIWKTKEWSLLHKLKGHKDSVYHMCLHSSAKILASVGKDRKIILWNMVNGTKLFRKTLNFNCYKVEWSLDENHLIILSDTSIHMISQETNATVKEFKHPKRINDFIMYEDFLIVAGDDGNLYFWNNVQDVNAESNYIGFKAHTPRVKRVDLIDINDKKTLVSCSTDGVVSLWDLTELLQNLEFVSEDKVLDEPLKAGYTLTTFQRIITLHVHESSQLTAVQNGGNDNDDDEDDAIHVVNGGDDTEDVGKKKRRNRREKSNKKDNLDKKSKKIKKVSFAVEEESNGKQGKNKDKKSKFKFDHQQKNNSKVSVEYDNAGGNKKNKKKNRNNKGKNM